MASTFSCRISTASTSSRAKLGLPFLAVTLTFMWQGVAAQPNVLGKPWVDVGLNTTLQCETVATFSRLRWRNSSFDEVDFTKADIIVQFTVASDRVDYRDDNGHFLFDKDDPRYTLTIREFNENDVGRYWCEVFTDRGRADSFDVRIKVPGRIETNINKNVPFDVEAGKDESVNVTTIDTSPKASTFSYSAGERHLLTDSDPFCDQNLDGLYTCVSTLTFTPMTSDDGKMLLCEIFLENVDDGTTVNIATLAVKDPCEPNPCKNGGTCIILEGATCNCPEGYKGPLCEVPPTTAEPTVPSTTTAPPTFPVLAIIAIVIGCVLVICVIGFIVYRCCSKKETDARGGANEIGMKGSKDGGAEKHHLEKNGSDPS